MKKETKVKEVNTKNLVLKTLGEIRKRTDRSISKTKSVELTELEVSFINPAFEYCTISCEDILTTTTATKESEGANYILFVPHDSYQREKEENKKFNSSMIASVILFGNVHGTVIINPRSENAIAIVDGQHRIITLRNFLLNKFPFRVSDVNYDLFPENKKNLYKAELTKFEGKFFKDMPKTVKDKFNKLLLMAEVMKFPDVKSDEEIVAEEASTFLISNVNMSAPNKDQQNKAQRFGKWWTDANEMAKSSEYKNFVNCVKNDTKYARTELFSQLRALTVYSMDSIRRFKSLKEMSFLAMTEYRNNSDDEETFTEFKELMNELDSKGLSSLPKNISICSKTESLKKTNNKTSVFLLRALILFASNNQNKIKHINNLEDIIAKLYENTNTYFYKQHSDQLGSPSKLVRVVKVWEKYVDAYLNDEELDIDAAYKSEDFRKKG